MGLLRRPTPGEIVEGGRCNRPCEPGAQSCASQNQFAGSPPFAFHTGQTVATNIEQAEIYKKAATTCKEAATPRRIASISGGP
jgi:hypothetical protein